MVVLLAVRFLAELGMLAATVWGLWAAFLASVPARGHEPAQRGG